MALVFMDGFDHYDPNVTAETAVKWSEDSSTTYYGKGTGRSGSGNCLTIVNSYGYLQHNFVSPQDEIIIGFAIMVNAWPSSLTYGCLIALQAYDTSPSTDFNLTLDTTGHLSADLGTTSLGTSTGTVSKNVWHHIELRVKLHDTLGEVEVRLDGSETAVIDLSSVDTKGGSSATIDSVLLCGFDSMTTSYDDVYILDTTGSSNNAFIGDCKIQLLSPDDDEGTNDFTATGTGTTNADRVDEASADDDTTYTSSTTATDKDIYTYGALSGTIGTVMGLQINSLLKKDDAGAPRAARNLCKHSSTTGTGDTEYMTINYALYTTVFELNPSTAAAWTETEVNAMSAGVELVT